MLLILLYFFNPTVTSLRAIQLASELEKEHKKLGCQRASLESLSEASCVFDAERWLEIIGELGVQLQLLQTRGRDQRLKDIQQLSTLVDGTLMSALPRMMEASWRKENDCNGLVKWRLHTHFEVDQYVPRRIDVRPDGGGALDERAVLERTIEPDQLYVMDRGYANFALFNSIVAKKSSYVCRLRDNSANEVTETRDLNCNAYSSPCSFTVFENLPDHRRPNVHRQHWLREIVFIVLCGTVTGCQSWTDIDLFRSSCGRCQEQRNHRRSDVVGFAGYQRCRGDAGCGELPTKDLGQHSRQRRRLCCQR
ncbi:MAG TPA: transposase family protein [Pirellulaceae bacterium]|nr:transposase family protein [Pirellulaceae bacterium]HMO92238.1 transposase family protein [Pirellulaceae bacterium]HMP70747.1 transposase family protein [Pirellulaceae bacterium]